MRTLARRIVLSLPVMIVLGFTEEVRAQTRAWGVGVGVGVGYGPYWGPYWGGGWAYQPNYYGGTWGNGLSMYGPPVPTGKPVPGMFGGGDSQFFPLPRLYPGWVYEVYVPVHSPATLPPGLIQGDSPFNKLPPPAPLLDKPTALEIEVRLPQEDARIFVDGAATKSSGIVRTFATPPQDRVQTLIYDIRAEWMVDGRTTTHTKRVIGRPGERIVVEFK
jgi:uncharacterized protein (TIGR03000 family)